MEPTKLQVIDGLEQFSINRKGLRKHKKPDIDLSDKSISRTISGLSLATTWIYITTEQQIIDLLLPDLEEYKKRYVNKRIPLAFDLESHWKDKSYIIECTKDSAPLFIERDDGDLEGTDRLFSIGLDPTVFDRQYLIDTFFISPQTIVKHFKHLFEKESILIGHYLKYDIGCLVRKYGIFPEEVRCTETIAKRRFLGDKLTKSGAKADFKLATLYKKFIKEEIFVALTGRTPDKYESFKHENQKADWSILKLPTSQLQYGADDVRLIFYLYKSEIDEVQRFINQYPQSGLINVIKIECQALIELAVAETAGVAVDVNYQENDLIPYLQYKLQEAEQKLSLIPECWIEKVEKKYRTKNKIKYVEEIHSSALARFHYSPDLIKVLKNLGYDNFKVSDKGNESCDKEAFNELFWRCEPGRNKDILSAIYQYKKAATFLSKNGENQLAFVHSNSRVHPTYFPLAAQTGRMAAVNPAIMTIPANDSMFEDPFLDDEGNPVINKDGSVKKKDAFTLFRRFYVASTVPTGRMVFIDSDFSNQEVRVAAELTGDQVLLDAFKNEKDLHQISADNLGVDRPTGKLFFLSTLYDARENNIIKTLYERSGGRIDFVGRKEEVTKLRDAHFELYNGLALGMKEASEFVENQMKPFKSLKDFAGRRPMLVGFDKWFKAHELWCLSAEQERMAWKIRKGEMEDVLHRDYKVYNSRTDKWSTWGNEWNKTIRSMARQYWNFKIQGPCSVILKLAMVRAGRNLRDRGYCPYTQAGLRIFVHDEILVECLEELYEDVKDILVEAMTWALNQVLTKVPAKVSFGRGYSWDEASP